MSRAHLLVVEDDQALLGVLADELQTEGYGVDLARDVAGASEQLQRQQYDLVVTDLKLPDGTGHDLLRRFNELPSRPLCLMVTAFGTIGDAVTALKQGADDFLTKPLDMDHLLLSVERLVERRHMQRELARMRDLVEEGGFHGMVGNSGAMQRLADHLRLVARADGPVLVVGESGTGKELVAKAIHRESARPGPFVAINCAGIPGELIESELFGYEPGAFTGARRRRKGIFQQADGGTLLLDEIGEMPLELQAKLLRVLEEGRVRPVGAEGEEAVDVRVLAATHRDVRALVDAGQFRADLYYRLETFALEVPPLRDRGEDLDLLATYFLRRHAARQGKNVEVLNGEAMRLLRSYPFPGNVRELSNVMERAVVFSRSSEVATDDLPTRIARGSASGADGHELESLTGDLPSVEVLQRRYARQVLERTGGNKQRAAAILGITRGTLYRWLEVP